MTSSMRQIPPLIRKKSLYETCEEMRIRTIELQKPGAIPQVDPGTDTSAYIIARREILQGRVKIMPAHPWFDEKKSVD